MYLAYIMRSSRMDGNHQGRITVATDTYPMSYGDGLARHYDAQW